MTKAELKIKLDQCRAEQRTLVQKRLDEIDQVMKRYHARVTALFKEETELLWKLIEKDAPIIIRKGRAYKSRAEKVT